MWFITGTWDTEKGQLIVFQPYKKGVKMGPERLLHVQQCPRRLKKELLVSLDGLVFFYLTEIIALEIEMQKTPNLELSCLLIYYEISDAQCNFLLLPSVFLSPLMCEISLKFVDFFSLEYLRVLKFCMYLPFSQCCSVTQAKDILMNSSYLPSLYLLHFFS